MKKFIAGTALALLSTFTVAAQECSLEFSKSAPNLRYVFNDNGTVRDKITGLTWMRCPIGQTWNEKASTCTGESTGMFWQAALSEVEAINQSENHKLHQFGGVEKWRMPNIKELYSLSEVSCRTPSLNRKAFSGAFTTTTLDGDVRALVWSNTHKPGSDSVFVVDTRNAEIFDYAITSGKFSVLLVAE